MNKIILTASFIALIPVSASAQLLGGGGLGGGLGGSLGGTLNTTIGSTLESSTRSVRSTIDQTVQGSAATDGDQSVDARTGTVSANRSANGSITGSTASLADLAVPQLGGMANGSATGEASGQGNASAELFGTDTVSGALAPVAGQAQGTASGAVGQATASSQGALGGINSTPTPGLPAFGPVTGSASGSGAADGNGAASLTSIPLAVAGSTASTTGGAGSVSPGMPVMTPEGASLGKVEQIVANGRGEVQQVVVSQGNVTRTLPAGMFSANGNALIASTAQGTASSGKSAERTQPISEEAN